MTKDKHELTPQPPGGQFLVYEAEDGQIKIEVRLEGETVWLTQRLMAELFQKDVRTISGHVVNVYDEGELAPEATIRKFRIVQAEGKREVARMVDFYNLDMIISVGYRPGYALPSPAPPKNLGWGGTPLIGSSDERTKDIPESLY